MERREREREIVSRPEKKMATAFLVLISVVVAAGLSSQAASTNQPSRPCSRGSNDPKLVPAPPVHNFLCELKYP